MDSPERCEEEEEEEEEEEDNTISMATVFNLDRLHANGEKLSLFIVNAVYIPMLSS